ncbi:MAG: C4-dicarboxylate ABC transporter substrate-binding protein [Gammaproteobacteria bacterium]|nr:MAG: C4-dicarboxylate ABC transporter substrate-binding protein [Gammaproteobacteria bacterium]
MFKKYLLTLLLPAMLASGVANAKEFKISLGDAEGGTQHKIAKTFADLLSKKTGGKHTGAIFPNGQLGSEQDTINNAAMGTLDFSVVAINNVTPFSPTVGVLTLPYVIQSADEAKLLVEGDVGKELTENTIRDANVRIIGWAYSGFRVLTNSKRPVKTLDDLKGLVIRVPKNEVMIATYQSWGVNPTPMAWSETFTALQQGVVHGQDNPYITNAAMKFDEIQKYVTNIRYVFSLEPLVVSEMVFQEQPKDVQQAILDAGKEATAVSFQYLKDTEDGIKAKFKENGIVISDPADGEKEWIEKATKTVWPKFYDSIGGKEKLDNVLKVLGR